MKSFVLLLAPIWISSFTATALAAPPTRKTSAANSLAKRLDQSLRLRRAHVAPIASDTVFLRRVYLDLHGTIPTASQVRSFLGDGSEDKRQRVIDELLAAEEFARLWSRRWCEVLLQDYDQLQGRIDEKDLAGEFGRRSLRRFQRWLQEEIAREAPWHEVTTRLVQSTGKLSGHPEAYYKATFFRDEVDALTLASAVSRSLLGVQISCARCHDHPFDRWKQADYYGLAAFFIGLRATADGDEELTGVEIMEVRHDGALAVDEETYPPTFFFGGRARQEAARLPQLAAFLVRHRDQLARNVVNRTWATLLGRGFVEPVDDFNLQNPPQKPRALDLLTREFLKRGESLKFLVRAICNSQAYQRATTGGGASWLETAAIRPLTAEQMFNSIVTACSGAEKSGDIRPPAHQEEREKFFDLLRDVYPPGQPWTAVSPLPGNTAQVLFLQNGKWVREAIERGGLLTRVRFLYETTEENIEQIFYAALCRPPSKEERERYVEYVGANGGLKKYADVMWTLINSAEFATLH